MNILYIHGFGSKFDRNSTKIARLTALGNVFGMDIDYTIKSADIYAKLGDYVVTHGIDLIVGTSMGGFFASMVGSGYGIPFVAINPAIDPATTLRDRIGSGVDYAGNEYKLTHEVVAGYGKFALNGCGLVLLDEGDELFSASKTVEALADHYDIKVFAGGSHRFVHMEDAIPVIKAHYENSEVTYGMA